MTKLAIYDATNGAKVFLMTCANGYEWTVRVEGGAK